MAAPHAHVHSHAHHEPALDAPEAFQMLSYFLSDPNYSAASDLRAYLPDIRNIAFYYRFMLDTTQLPESQVALVRQFIAQAYAAQQVLQRFPEE